MSPDAITHLLVTYRYWILIPLTFLEGPIVAFAAGTLAAVGYFNVYLLAALFFVRDIVMDTIFYYLGRFGGDTKFVKNLLRKVRVRRDHLDGVRHLWETRPFRTMAVSKLSYGIAPAFMAVAGMVRYPLSRYLWWGSVVAVVEYGSLLVIGYFFGQQLSASASHVIETVQYAIAGFALVASGYYLFSIYLRHRALKEDERLYHE